jgi:hypothetical protein
MQHARRAWILVLAVGVAGCTKAPTEAEKRAAERTPTATPPAKLPPLVDPASAKAGSPQRAVLRLLRQVQLETLPLAPDSYDPRIVAGLGRDTIVRALGSQASAFQSARVSRPLLTRDNGRVVVTLALKPREGPASRQSFVMVRADGQWFVGYDTLLAGGLRFIGRKDGTGEESATKYARLFGSITKGPTPIPAAAPAG